MCSAIVAADGRASSACAELEHSVAGATSAARMIPVGSNDARYRPSDNRYVVVSQVEFGTFVQLDLPEAWMTTPS